MKKDLDWFRMQEFASMDEMLLFSQREQHTMNNMPKSRYFFTATCLLISLALFLPSLVKADQLFPYQSGGKIGYVDADMRIRIPATWDYGSYFRNGETAIVRIDADVRKPLYGLIDSEGLFLVPIGEHRIIAGEGGDYFGGEDGYYLIFDYSSHLFGYYDIRNHYYASPKYTSIDPHFRDESEYNMLFVGSVIMHGEEQPAAYINSATEEILCEFDYAEHGNPYYGTVLCREIHGNDWIQYANGTRIPLDEQFELDSYSINQGLFIVRDDEGYGLMSISGVMTTSTHYRSIEYDPYDYCYYGIDCEGETIIVFAELP